MPHALCRQLAALFMVAMPPLMARAGDWPQWRHDAQRSASAPDELPAKLGLHWVRELPPLKPAWPDQPKMQFDAAYEPIVVGQQLVVGSSHDDSVTAYDTRTGTEMWTFFADGPVRFAPLAWEDRIYFVSDDGYLYCLQADDGALLWRFRGGPSDRKILGNERMISTWPARGAPVIADGRIYFAAGIWPFMGVFLHALDARTGEVVWTNDGDGSIYIKQPHNTDSFAGVAPQGPLVAIGDKLLVPGGRSVPACFDRASGKLVYYQLADNSKRGGGSSVSATHGIVFNGGAAFDLDTEQHLKDVGDYVAFAGDRLFDGEGGKLRELDLSSSIKKEGIVLDRKGISVKTVEWSIGEVGKAASPSLTALIKSGSRLYVGSAGRLLAYDLPLSADGKTEPAWSIQIEGTPISLVAADDRLFAATREGRVLCFGDVQSPSPTSFQRPAEPLAADAAARARIDSTWGNQCSRRLLSRLVRLGAADRRDRAAIEAADCRGRAGRRRRKRTAIEAPRWGHWRRARERAGGRLAEGRFAAVLRQPGDCRLAAVSGPRARSGNRPHLCLPASLRRRGLSADRSQRSRFADCRHEAVRPVRCRVETSRRHDAPFSGRGA
jgi:outer membrane protein assembly factor BamB